MPNLPHLAAELLCRRTDPSRFPFETTAELGDLPEVVGQDRAVEALRFGIGIRRAGYNLFALGPPATGKHTIVRQFVERRAASEPAPSDWCYVNNFKAAQEPIALELPAGMGAKLRGDIDRLIGELRVVVPALFETDDYRARKQAIEDELKQRQSKAFSELGERARARGMALVHTPGGFVLAPLEGERVLPPDEFERLPEERRRQIETDSVELREQLRRVFGEIPDWERESREKLKRLDNEVTIAAIGKMIDGLRRTYGALPAVLRHLDALQQDVIDRVDDFRGTSELSSIAQAMLPLAGISGGRASFRRYGVNVLVDHSEADGAPVVYEDHPSYPNVLGMVENISQLGTLVTDFNLIKSGALHRANGGYLMLDARELLLQPYAWEGVKQALRSGEIRVESVGQMLGLASTVSLDPQPIPLQVKVILLGDRVLYYLLCHLDPQFSELFKVAADFEEEMDRSPENDLLYARLLATLARKEALLPLDRGAVARVLDQSARLLGDAQKLSTRMGLVADLLREADHWARESHSRVVAAADVQKAIDAQIRRANRVEQRLQEEMGRGTILVDATGERVGQVNGLSVVELGRHTFGRPSRITARVRLGTGEVLDIEREAEMGGPIHSKGVLILRGFLGARYAVDCPLALSASLVFEQSYGPVEGDSASLAELCALLSALAQVPIRQSLAVTGSVNQQGQVQAVGGVNEKIEGFFDLCRARGLTGEQGVLIPAANVQHLMLRADVVEAAAAGRFHVFPVDSVDRAIELMTGLSAGERDASGRYPSASFSGRVEARLIALADRLREFGRAPQETTAR
ncbi:MAG TPA: ATP-binding protein [Thermoanaerobaculia bacterium]|nr:ATP-binding protein [Thermoanaerobaculia bacterium]